MKNEMKLRPFPFIAAAALLAALPLGANAQDYAGKARIDTTVGLDRGGTVDLSLISGRIRVTGWVRQEGIRFELELGSLDIHHLGEIGDAKQAVGFADHRIVTAHGGEIEATSVSGDVDVANGVREVSVESVSGSAHAAQINGNLRAESVSGDVRVETVTGNVEASSVSGSIRLIGVQSKDVRTETVSGDVVYSGSIEPGGRYSFESHSGNVRLSIPRGAGAQFSVETFSGDITTDFPVTVPPTSGTREGRMDFTIGDGRARVTAQTFSGRIVINSGADSTIRRDDE